MSAATWRPAISCPRYGSCLLYTSCVFHQGPYSDLGQAYAFACKWLEQNGYEAADFSREHYIDGMWNKEDPAQWLTEIQIPIKR